MFLSCNNILPCSSFNLQNLSSKTHFMASLKKSFGRAMMYEIIIVFLLLPMVDPARIAKPNCQSKCGNATIPYPFGIGPGCFLEEQFEIICLKEKPNDTNVPTRAMLDKSNIYVVNISLENSDLLIAQPQESPAVNSSPNLNDTPFVLWQVGQSVNYVELRLQWGLTNDTFRPDSPDTMISNKSLQKYISVGGPVTYATLDRDRTCYPERSGYQRHGGGGMKCSVTLWQWFCRSGYEGNPYLNNGCQDIDECLQPNACPHGHQCNNKPGTYYCASNITTTSTNSKSKSTAIIVGTTTGIGVMFLLFLGWWLRKVIKKRQETKLKEKYFKQNGGLLFQEQLYSNEGTTMTKSKVFTSEELDKATDHFNENRILGRGGQGTVYKGMLVDGNIVAIKKSKIENPTKLQQFINEVLILSQISHRNVVKLLGCCLETEVPLIVYEFVPNGTLYQYLHNPSEEIALSWDIRLRLALETAEALSYLHSAAAIPIYHRDIKSSNILLDEKYRAKIADFGISKSIALDQTHVTTTVQGTFGYLDPEYFQLSQLTDKSDVYSFGIVLVELLTGQKAVFSLREDEVKGLAAHFIHSLENDNFWNIVDPKLLKKVVMEEMTKVAYLAKQCLNLNGKNRPSMREVAMELEGIRRLRVVNLEEEKQEEYKYGGTTELHATWDIESSIATSLLDDQPLLSIKTM